MTRPAHLVAADLAACATEAAALESRRAGLHSELARALVPAAQAPAPAPAEYLTTNEAAALLGVSAGHLKALRARDDGPIPHRIGRAVRYRRSEVEVWGCKYPEANAVRVPSGPGYVALAANGKPRRFC